MLHRTIDSPTLSATPTFYEALKARPWPGNVRELQSVVERAATLARGGVLTEDHIATDEVTAAEQHQSIELEQRIRELIDEWTRQHWNESSESALYEQLIALIDPAILKTAFELSEKQYSAAARRLGIHRTTLKKKLDESSEQE